MTHEKREKKEEEIYVWLILEIGVAKLEDWKIGIIEQLDSWTLNFLNVIRVEIVNNDKLCLLFPEEIGKKRR